MKDKEEDGAKSEAGRQWNGVDGFDAQDFGTRPADRERRTVKSVGKGRKVFIFSKRRDFLNGTPFGYMKRMDTDGRLVDQVRERF